MVAKITFPHLILRAVNYNEQKVKKNDARCIYAHNFLKDAESLCFHQKLDRFEKLIVLNQRAKTNCIHISLNFHPKEYLTNHKSTQIAKAYMAKIGFVN